jgi:predicted nucleic acid-binding Zn ribbon protein
MYCYRCGKLTHKGDLVCSHCGAHLRHRSQKSNYGMLIVRAALIILVVLLLFYMFRKP